MRTIKFRGYTKETADTYRTVEFDLEDLMIGTHDIRTVDLKFWKVVQFTGLLDKNGKEIWEGDVVSEWGDKYEVLFGDGRFYCNRIGRRESHRLYPPAMEVIGNVYEHPELLKP